MIKRNIFLICLVFLASCTIFSRNSTHYASSREIINNMGNGLMGSNITKLSAYDKRQALTAEYTALEYNETGKILKWQAKTAISFGTVTPGQPYKVGSQNCRQYSHAFTINGRAQTVRGSACRNDDGSWTVLN